MKCLQSLVTILIAVLSVSIANANEITIAEAYKDKISIHSTTTSESDLISLNKPNEFGISFNFFNQFIVSDKKIKLLDLDASDTSYRGSDIRLIVIVAETISIKSSVELVGPAADILFINADFQPFDLNAGEIKTDDYLVECINCSFKNFQRISLVSALLPINESSNVGNVSGIGAIPPTLKSRLVVDGLDAAGSFQIDFIGARQLISGVVNSNERVNRNYDGEYTSSEDGDLVVGGGSVSIVSGDIEWEYESSSISGLMNSQWPKDVFYFSSFNALFETSSIRMMSSDDIRFEGEVVTRSDLFGTYRYKGKIQLVEEGVLIQSLNGGVKIGARVASNGAVVVKSAKSTNLNSSSDFEGEEIKLISVEDFYSRGKLTGDLVSISAKNVTNHGDVGASSLLRVSAVENIQNQRGAVMVSPDIFLHARNGMVLNGSRSTNTILSGYNSLDTSYGVIEDELGKPEILGLGVSDLNPPNSYKIGTYYRFFEDKFGKQPDISYSFPCLLCGDVGVLSGVYDDFSAFIVGESIRIKAKAFENINPYWVKANDFEEIYLDNLKANQVAVSAESLLAIEASNYILNSSAILKVNEVDSVIKINTKIVSNERYRGLFLLGEYEFANTVMSYAPRVYAYSPPGLISSMGRVEVKADAGLVNNASYLEVFGGGRFKTPIVRDVGISKGGVTPGVETDRSLYQKYWIEVATHCYRKQLSVECDSTEALEEFLEAQFQRVGYPSEMDTLFYVAGEESGVEGRFHSKKNNPLDAITPMITVDFLLQSNLNPLDVKITDLLAISYVPDFERILSPDVVDIEGNSVYLTTVDHELNPTIVNGKPVENVKAIEEVKEFSLFEVMSALYEMLISSISDFFSEVIR